MDTGSIPRHTRRGFADRSGPGNLAAALTVPGKEIMDFSPRSNLCAEDRRLLDQLVQFLSQDIQEVEDLQVAPAVLAAGVQPLMPSSTDSPPAGTGNFSRQCRSVHTEVLDNGLRQETFENGSMLRKDALGRVVEVFSAAGECLYISYDQSGGLVEFTRISGNGKIQSRGTKGRHSVTVRDGNGRVMAIGDCMTVDPWGRFYLHTHDGQYFSLDLVAGIHWERRRLFRQDGKVEFVTAAFALDGFRMATSYAKTGFENVSSRDNLYRFYGRDGTVVEFRSEEDFRHLIPSRATPPASFPVHKSWRRCHQAHTAWESVKEYLSCVS